MLTSYLFSGKTINQLFEKLYLSLEKEMTHTPLWKFVRVDEMRVNKTTQSLEVPIALPSNRKFFIAIYDEISEQDQPDQLRGVVFIRAHVRRSVWIEEIGHSLATWVQDALMEAPHVKSTSLSEATENEPTSGTFIKIVFFDIGPGRLLEKTGQKTYRAKTSWITRFLYRLEKRIAQAYGA